MLSELIGLTPVAQLDGSASTADITLSSLPNPCPHNVVVAFMRAAPNLNWPLRHRHRRRHRRHTHVLKLQRDCGAGTAVRNPRKGTAAIAVCGRSSASTALSFTESTACELPR